MKRLATLLAALAVTLGLASAPALLVTSSAQAAETTPGCATKAEYRAVKKGATIKKARRIIGAKGRVYSSYSFSNGDGSKSLKFRQCRRSWGMSSIYFDFEKTEREVYVPDWYCYDGDCEDWGGYETRYRTPYIMTSKYAFWF